MNILLAEILCSIPDEYEMSFKQNGLAECRFKDISIDICWYNDSMPCNMTYYNAMDEVHRPYSEGPAILAWHEDGKLSLIGYFENGKRHRPSSEGPAYQEWSYDGSSYYEEHWENGKRINEHILS